MYAWPIGSTFTIKFHQTWVKYAPYMDPLGNINTSETLRTSSLSLNKGKANYLIKNSLHQPSVSGNFVTCDEVQHLTCAYWCEQCIYNLHHSSLEACNRYHHHHSSIIFHQPTWTHMIDTWVSWFNMLRLKGTSPKSHSLTWAKTQHLVVLLLGGGWGWNPPESSCFPWKNRNHLTTETKEASDSPVVKKKNKK